MPINNVHELGTAGLKANKSKVFTIVLDGPQIYAITKILKKLAIESTEYMDVANAVECHEFIFSQAKEQGF